jgi:hypothetical protein
MKNFTVTNKPAALQVFPPKTKSATYCITYLSHMQMVESNLIEHILQCYGLIEKIIKFFSIGIILSLISKMHEVIRKNIWLFKWH